MKNSGVKRNSRRHQSPAGLVDESPALPAGALQLVAVALGTRKK
jgi:hypothetical protein